MNGGTEDEDRPAVTGAPVGQADARREVLTGDDAGESYPADRVAPDRGSSAPQDQP